MRLVFLICGMFLGGELPAQDVFVDKGACPGEGCVYGERWVARARVRLLSAPDLSATVVGILDTGMAVQTVTGEVHTIPARFTVRQPHGEFAPGDIVHVYTYLGEGWFRVRHDGETKEADLGFSPWGGSSGKRCELEDRCWGTLQEELRLDWWIKVRTPDGTEGWTLDAMSFAEPKQH